MTTPKEKTEEKKEVQNKKEKHKERFKILNPLEPKEALRPPVKDPECGRWDV